MSELLAHALANLRVVLQQEASDNCVGVTVFFNNEGCEIGYMARTPSSLQREGISMRNLRGDWVK